MNETPLVDIRKFAEFSEWLKKMEKIYREDERERCAKVCEEKFNACVFDDYRDACQDIRAAIRSMK